MKSKIQIAVGIAAALVVMAGAMQTAGQGWTMELVFRVKEIFRLITTHLT